MTDLPTPIARYFETINADDWDGLAKVFHTDAEMLAVGARPRRGRDDVLAYYPKTLAPWKEHHDEPTRWMVCGDTTTVEIAFTGMTADGTPVTFDAVDVFDLEDGRIRKVTTWYDVAAIRRQLPTATPPTIAAYFKAVNEEDWDTLAQLWTDDATATFVGAKPLAGKRDILDFYRRLFRVWSRHHDEPTRVLLDGSTATVEVHFTGTTHDRKDIAFDAVDVIDLAPDGRFHRLTNWYDVAWVRNALSGG